jgi:predicted RNA-binding protein Jag
MEDEIEANEKKKEVYVLISVKPKYAEEFCIMMVACKELCKRTCKSKNLAKIDDVFSVLGPFDFLLELSGEGKNEEEMDKKINKTIFKIRETLGSYIDETCTLTKFDLSEILKNKAKELFGKAKFFKEKKCDELNDFKEFFKETFMTHGDIHEHENNKVFSYQTFNRLCELREELECDTAKIQKTEVKNKTIKDVHVLIKIKPEYTEQFCVAMAVCKSLCNRASASQNLAKIDEVFSVFGLFDFLLELSGEGRNKDEKINKTIFKIRETLGSYINETLTITKFKIPITNGELENFFEKKIEEKYIAKLPDKVGETIPDESKHEDYEIDLEELYDAETTPLKNLLKKAKTLWEPEDLNKRIDELSNRVDELEKRS